MHAQSERRRASGCRGSHGAGGCCIIQRTRQFNVRGSRIIDSYRRAGVISTHLGISLRITWKGTPLHEQWLTDPGWHADRGLHTSDRRETGRHPH